METVIQETHRISPSEIAIITEMEKRVMKAFKEKNEHDFTHAFAKDYIGVAGDGVKDAAGEVAGMFKLDLDHLSSENERVSFPANNLAIMTYTMITDGKMDSKPLSATIYCSTVYIKRNDRWEAILHTESMKP